MKEELLKIAQESLSSDEVTAIVKEKFMNALGSAIEDAFRWGDAKKVIEKKVKEVMVPYIENYDFSEYLPKLDSVLTEIVNSDACIADKKILENFKGLVTEPEQKEIKLTDLFKAWVKQCEKDIDTDGLDIDYDDGVSYQSVDCEMRFELEDKPSWSSLQRAVITFENEHDEKLNVEIPVSKWIWGSGKEEPYTLSTCKDLTISSLRRLNDFEILLLRLARADAAIIIDRDYDDSYIRPEKEPEPSFS
ncbi:MAG TPA: hypothetical protein H9742_14335 [Candidatus Acetatifactor stercoripullorum]|uniref:Uncharacterized protein n=1 Tax=Candidatus Acetatifactor stercoripullorum TaxID=2838414 RepID=A0A9D1R819_9FIRM|nr:hypothetical protein [Candidatus Acetatifactor stercoripullorum]